MREQTAKFLLIFSGQNAAYKGLHCNQFTKIGPVDFVTLKPSQRGAVDPMAIEIEIPEQLFYIMEMKEYERILVNVDATASFVQSVIGYVPRSTVESSV